MMQRNCKLFVALVFMGSSVVAQSYKPTPTDIGRVVHENKTWGSKTNTSAGLQYTYSSGNKQLKPVDLHLSSPAVTQKQFLQVEELIAKETPKGPVLAVRPATYYENLGFFCKKEIQLQRVSIVSVKFRLGSYDYVNWLEGKR